MLLSSLVFSACLSDYPKSLLPEDKAYDNATNLYINTVANLYHNIGGNKDSEGLQGTYRGIYDYNTFCTDEAIIPTRGGDWYDGGFWQNLYLHTWTSTDIALYDTWCYLYKAVMMCNHSLAQIDAHKNIITPDQYNKYKAEVKALRCLFYGELLDLFGRVPLVESDEVSLDKAKQVERGELFRFIVNELQSSLPFLADQRSNFEGEYYGRITRHVAEFMLARLMLNAEVYNDDNWIDGVRTLGSQILFNVDGQNMNAWEACIHYCDRIEAAGYTLEKYYNDNFRVHNEKSHENIFTIPMDKMKYQNEFWNLFRSRHYKHGECLGMAAENGSSATLSTVRAFAYGTDSVDTRFAFNFYSDTVHIDGKAVRQDNGKALVYHPLVMAIDLTGSPYEKTAGARMAKYEIDRTAHADGKLQDNDIVLFRFADVLLMRAEAKVRNGKNGQREMDAVRTRAGMPPRPATLNNILAERLLELMWEGTRRRDLIRFGLFGNAYDIRPRLENEQKGFTTVYPIPATALKLNRKLRQNYGY